MLRSLSILEGTQSRVDLTDNRSALPFSFPWARPPERDCPDWSHSSCTLHSVNLPDSQPRCLNLSMEEELIHNYLAPILRAYCLRLLSPRTPGCGDIHLQRCPRGPRWATKGDRACQGGVAPGQGWCRLSERSPRAWTRRITRHSGPEPRQTGPGFWSGSEKFRLWIGAWPQRLLSAQDWKGCAGPI